jgi:hypothetical protein
MLVTYLLDQSNNKPSNSCCPAVTLDISPLLATPPSRDLYTTGKRGAAVHIDCAVRRGTAKMSLPCDQSPTHGKEYKHGKHEKGRTAKKHPRQRVKQTHDKEKNHGKE